VLLHVTACAQLFVAGPHAMPLHAVVLSGVQHVLSVMQTPAFGHGSEQSTVWPQLFRTLVLQTPLQAVVLSGVQHVFVVESHTSFDELQLTVPPLPHGTVWLQLLTAVPHVWPAHVCESGWGTHPHAPFVQAAPPGQPGHVVG
jgi:hypothetical protein